MKGNICAHTCQAPTGNICLSPEQEWETLLTLVTDSELTSSQVKIHFGNRDEGAMLILHSLIRPQTQHLPAQQQRWNCREFFFGLQINTQRSLNEKCLFLSLQPSSPFLVSSHAASAPYKGFFRVAGPQSCLGSLAVLSSLLCCVPPSHLHQLQSLDIHINKDSENLLLAKKRHLQGENAVRKLMNLQAFFPLQLLLARRKGCAGPCPSEEEAVGRWAEIDFLWVVPLSIQTCTSCTCAVHSSNPEPRPNEQHDTALYNCHQMESFRYTLHTYIYMQSAKTVRLESSCIILKSELQQTESRKILLKDFCVKVIIPCCAETQLLRRQTSFISRLQTRIYCIHTEIVQMLVQNMHFISHVVRVCLEFQPLHLYFELFQTLSLQFITELLSAFFHF